MFPFGWLLGLVLPACGAAGAHGLPVPPLMAITRIERPASPNTALAAPSGFRPPPDLVTPLYAVPPARLFAAVAAVAAKEPRTYPAVAYTAAMQADWVVRSAVWNFPDLVTAQVLAAPGGGSELVLYSRSVYGYGDFGVNRRRLQTWLRALKTTLTLPGERQPQA